MGKANRKQQSGSPLTLKERICFNRTKPPLQSQESSTEKGDKCFETRVISLGSVSTQLSCLTAV